MLVQVGFVGRPLYRYLVPRCFLSQTRFIDTSVSFDQQTPPLKTTRDKSQTCHGPAALYLQHLTIVPLTTRGDGGWSIYWSKIAIFSYSTFSAPLWVGASEYCHNVWYRKTRMVWLPSSEKQEAQLSLTNRAMLVCKVIEIWQDFLSEYVDKKFTYICYGRLIRHEWIYYGSKNCVICNCYKIV